MNFNTYYILSFDSTHSSIATKKILNGKIDFRIIPTLREISASCGISIKLNEKNYNKLVSLIEQNIVDNRFFSIYKIIEDEQKNNTKITFIS